MAARIFKTIFSLIILAVFAALLAAVGIHYFSGKKTTITEAITETVRSTPLAELLPANGACAFPMEWSVGRIDSGFNVGKSQMETAVNTAAGLWDEALGVKLFSESPAGALKIGLIYDERQKETDLLGKLGLTISGSRQSFDSLQASYRELQSQFEAAKASYQTSADAFAADQDALNQKIQYWNERGGAPPAEYAAIQEGQASQKAGFDALEQNRLALNARAGDLNNLAAILNQMAKDLNLQIKEYNTGGAVIRNVFEAGVYESDQAGRRIFVYQFENKDKLISVLEHELGHALGLDHDPDPSSIMNAVNQGPSQTILAADVAALKAKCPNLK